MLWIKTSAFAHFVTRCCMPATFLPFYVQPAGACGAGKRGYKRLHASLLLR
jgi:hypothetical protein